MQLVINIALPRRRALVGLLLVVALLVPSTALAVHVFGDVPDSHTFHNDIAAIAGAGITTGCGGGNFCPDSSLTRGQEAAFMRRALGRAAGDIGSSVTVPAATLVTVAETTITPGIAGGAPSSANGFLLVNGSVTLYEGNPDLCICSISVRAYVDGVAVSGTQYVFLPDNTVFESGSASISVAVPVAAGPKVVSLRVNEYQGNESLVAYASLTALYVPFGHAGTDTLGSASSSAEEAPDPIIEMP
jgi:hypothetical protein